MRSLISPMNSCGLKALSFVAIQVYQQLASCRGLVLCPCCSLRSLDLKRSEQLQLPKCLGASESYEQWVASLLQLLPEVQGIRLEC